MNRRIGSENCRDCGFDSGNSLLTMGTGRRREQRKDIGEDHKCQKVRALAQYHVKKREREREREREKE